MTSGSSDAPGVDSLGRRVREQRIRAGLTQQQLADLVKRHRVTITRIEIDKKRPSPLLVTSLAKALNVSRDALDPQGVTL